jgi:hypothetical protein
MSTIIRLPPIDPRGPQEQEALQRAHDTRRARNVYRAWCERMAALRPRPAPTPKNVIYFGSAAGEETSN